MRKTARTVSLILLLPFFFMLQALLVPHLHFDEHGEVHAHVHLVADELSGSTHQENIDNEDHELASSTGHRHSHDELHVSEPVIGFPAFSYKVKIPALELLSTEFSAIPLQWARRLTPSFSSFNGTSYLQHVFRVGHTIALEKHIQLILSVRLTT